MSAETQYASNGVVSRTLLRPAYSRAVSFDFAEGQELTKHTSTQNALIQILSGEWDFFLAGKPRALQAGDLLFMLANLPQADRAIEQFPTLLTLFNPEERSPAKSAFHPSGQSPTK